MAVSVREIFLALPSYFIKGGTDKDMSIYFSLEDEKWTLVVGPEKCEVKEGKALENADAFLKTSKDMFIKMVMKGYTPGFMDFTRGKISSNDPMSLMVLKQAFKFPE